MGAGASCAERESTPLNERLRTMLILRSYNCRPRDWTMQEQFEAFADDGVMTKDRLTKALRLSECPRIEALLDRYLLRPSPANISASSNAAAAEDTSISVSALIFLIEGTSERSKPLPRPVAYQYDTRSPPIATKAQSECSLPFEVGVDAVSLRIREEPTPTAPTSGAVATATIAAAEESAPVCTGDNRSVEMSPRVVPLTPKSAIALDKPGARHKGHDASSSFDTGSAHPGADGFVEGPRDKDVEQSSESCPEDKCMTLVRHPGTTLGLRGEEAYRRPGPVHPVWRKKETLIQERIVQYTTLDDEGRVQELFETEKSQTEVLHMECKRTGEFAHRESTHYESGEAFNGEVVLEETGVEHYVHLRSIDDEYEHLESSLPARARQGGGGVGDGAAADPSAGQGGADGGAEGSPAGDFHNEGSDTGADGSVKNVVGMQNGPNDEEAQRSCDFSKGERNDGISRPQSIPLRQCSNGVSEDSAGIGLGIDAIERNGNGATCSGRSTRQYTSVPPPPYHYRSPTCSPRLSPRHGRSPYRQEGVGVRESSGRFDGSHRTRSAEDRQINASAGLDVLRQHFVNENEEEPMEGGGFEGLAGVDRVGVDESDIRLSTPTFRTEEQAPARLHDTGDGGGGGDGFASEAHTLGSRYFPGVHATRDVSSSRDDQLAWDVARTFAAVDIDGRNGDGGDGSVDSMVRDGASAIFFDNGSVKDNEGDSMGDAGGWRQAGENGSVLMGLDCFFREEEGSLVSSGLQKAAIKVDLPLNSPAKAFDRPASSEDTAASFKSGYAAHLLDGILSSYPAALTPEWDCGHDVDVEGVNMDSGLCTPDDGGDNRDLSGTAAPFCSNEWGRASYDSSDRGDFRFADGGGNDDPHRLPGDAITA